MDYNLETVSQGKPSSRKWSIGHFVPAVKSSECTGSLQKASVVPFKHQTQGFKTVFKNSNIQGLEMRVVGTVLAQQSQVPGFGLHLWQNKPESQYLESLYWIVLLLFPVQLIFSVFCAWVCISHRACKIICRIILRLRLLGKAHIYLFQLLRGNQKSRLTLIRFLTLIPFQL